MTIREEAEKYAESNDGGSDPRYNGLEEGYLAAFKGPTVKAMVEALEEIAKEPYFDSDPQSLLLWSISRARSALQKFQEARNE